MANNHSELEKRLWDAADDLRANSKLKSNEYAWRYNHRDDARAKFKALLLRSLG
jgi:hypothetical protein